MVHGSTIAAYVDDVLYILTQDTSITSGSPGVGVAGPPTTNGIARVDIGAIDTTVPNTIVPSTVQTSSVPGRVDLHWTSPGDNGGGIGIGFYDIYRNGAWVNRTRAPQFTDLAVSAGTTYTYALVAYDFHINGSVQNVSVKTPPLGAVDPRSVGVRSTGSYWAARASRSICARATSTTACRC